MRCLFVRLRSYFRGSCSCFEFLGRKATMPHCLTHMSKTFASSPEPILKKTNGLRTHLILKLRCFSFQRLLLTVSIRHGVALEMCRIVTSRVAKTDCRRCASGPLSVEHGDTRDVRSKTLLAYSNAASRIFTPYWRPLQLYLAHLACPHYHLRASRQTLMSGTKLTVSIVTPSL